MLPAINNPFFAALVLSALVSGGVGVILFRRRNIKGARSLLLIMASLTFWTIAYAAQTQTADLAWNKTWSNLSYIGIAYIPFLWMLFAAEYSNLVKPETISKLYLLAILPAISSLFFWTNDFHQLVWLNIRIVEGYGLYIQLAERGIYYWIHASISYGFMLAGTYLFVRFAARAPEAYRAQATATLLAVLVVFGANGLAVFWVIPATGLDITPFAFTVAGLLLAWGLFRLGLLDITPIPQETILECLSDGLLVTDKSQNVIFTNPIFDSMASLRPGSAVGNQVGDLMLHWPNIFQPYKYKMLTKTSIVSGSATAQIEVHAAPLIHSDLIIGEIYSVREISERREHDIFDEHLAKTGRQPPITIIVNAKDGKILDINSTFIAQMHFKREEVIGRTMLELGIWEIKTRAETMQAFYESSKLNDKLTNVFDKNRRNLTWLLSITPVNINGYALQVWNAKIKSNTGNL